MSDTQTITRRYQELRDFTKALKEAPVGPADSRYYEFHKSPGMPRGIDPITKLYAGVNLEPAAATCQLFSGFRGSGKTSELLRLRERLLGDGYHVVFVAGAEVVNLNKPLEPADLLISVAAAVAQHVERQRGASPAKESLVERIQGFFSNTNIDLKGVTVGATVDLPKVKLDVGKLALELSTNPSFKSSVQEALRGKISWLVTQFQAFMKEAREALGIAQNGLSPVVIVDDLEKIRGSGVDHDTVQQSMEHIFWEFHRELHIAGWHAIWTAPPYLQLLSSDVASAYDGSVVLPMVRLWANDDSRTPDRTGIDALRACLAKRGNATSFFPKEELLDRLILVSSGYLRGLIRLMRDIVRMTSLQDDPTKPLTENLVEQVIDDYVRECRTAIWREDLVWLAAVARSRRLEVENRNMIKRAAKLLDTAIIMTYRNGEEWVDVCHAARDLT